MWESLLLCASTVSCEQVLPGVLLGSTGHLLKRNAQTSFPSEKQYINSFEEDFGSDYLETDNSLLHMLRICMYLPIIM